MNKLARFRALPRREKRLVVEVFLVVAGVRLGLSLLDFRTFCRITGSAKRRLNRIRRGSRFSVDKILWAVEVAGRHIPAASCLTQALAADLLLARSGTPVSLRIGVLKNSEGRLDAHAWLESEGRIILGNRSNLSMFSVFPPVELI